MGALPHSITADSKVFFFEGEDSVSTEDFHLVLEKTALKLRLLDSAVAPSPCLVTPHLIGETICKSTFGLGHCSCLAVVGGCLDGRLRRRFRLGLLLRPQNGNIIVDDGNFGVQSEELILQNVLVLSVCQLRKRAPFANKPAAAGVLSGICSRGCPLVGCDLAAASEDCA